MVREKGAFASLKYKAKNLKTKVMEVTDGKGVTIILDAVGGEIFDESLKWSVVLVIIFLLKICITSLFGSFSVLLTKAK